MADVSSPMFIRRFADKHPYAFPYGSAVLISVAALAIVLILPYSRQQPVFLFFEVAVALATWLGGWKAGAVSLVGISIALAYLEQQGISTPTVFRLILNLVYVAGIIWVVAKLRFSQEALRQSGQGFRRLNAELEQRVSERTEQLQMANQELLREIADRTQVEKALRRSEAYLAEAQRLSHTGSWVWNVAAREYIHWSQEIYRLYDFDPEGGIPPFEAFLERIHPEDRSRFVDDLERAIRDRTDHETVFQTVLLGEAVKHIHEKSHPVLNASGDVIEFVGTAMDITERKSAELALRDSEELKRRIIESSRDCIKVLDLDGNLLFMSSGGQQLLEIDDINSYLNGCWIDFWQPEDRPRVIEAIAAAKAGGIGTFQAFCPSAKGDPRWWDVITTPICNADGQPEQLLSVSRDITERKRAEAEARESERRYREALTELAHANRVTTMGQLTASIAHEISQPIAATVTNAQAGLRWLGAQPPNLEEVRQTLGRIVNDGVRAGDVVGRIRDLIKKAPRRKEELQINEAILEVVALTRGEVVKNGVSVRTQLARSLPLIQADRVQLQQVVLNLIINAVEAMSGVGEGARELLISTGRDASNGVLVSLRDSGPGLDPASLQRLFDPFYTTKSSGMGMGLSICRSIVEAHRGRIWAGANEPRGAVFKFSLPLEPDETVSVGPMPAV